MIMRKLDPVHIVYPKTQIPYLCYILIADNGDLSLELLPENEVQIINEDQIIPEPHLKTTFSSLREFILAFSPKAQWSAFTKLFTPLPDESRTSFVDSFSDDELAQMRFTAHLEKTGFDENFGSAECANDAYIINYLSRDIDGYLTARNKENEHGYCWTDDLTINKGIHFCTLISYLTPEKQRLFLESQVIQAAIPELQLKELPEGQHDILDFAIRRCQLTNLAALEALFLASGYSTTEYQDYIYFQDYLNNKLTSTLLNSSCDSPEQTNLFKHLCRDYRATNEQSIFSSMSHETKRSLIISYLVNDYTTHRNGVETHASMIVDTLKEHHLITDQEILKQILLSLAESERRFLLFTLIKMELFDIELFDEAVCGGAFAKIIKDATLFQQLLASFKSSGNQAKIIDTWPIQDNYPSRGLSTFVNSMALPSSSRALSAVSNAPEVQPLSQELLIRMIKRVLLDPKENKFFSREFFKECDRAILVALLSDPTWILPLAKQSSHYNSSLVLALDELLPTLYDRQLTLNDVADDNLQTTLSHSILDHVELYMFHVSEIEQGNLPKLFSILPDKFLIDLYEGTSSRKLKYSIFNYNDFLPKERQCTIIQHLSISQLEKILRNTTATTERTSLLKLCSAEQKEKLAVYPAFQATQILLHKDSAQQENALLTCLQQLTNAAAITALLTELKNRHAYFSWGLEAKEPNQLIDRCLEALSSKETKMAFLTSSLVAYELQQAVDFSAYTSITIRSNDNDASGTSNRQCIYEILFPKMAASLEAKISEENNENLRKYYQKQLIILENILPKTRARPKPVETKPIETKPVDVKSADPKQPEQTQPDPVENITMQLSNIFDELNKSKLAKNKTFKPILIKLTTALETFKKDNEFKPFKAECEKILASVDKQITTTPESYAEHAVYGFIWMMRSALRLLDLLFTFAAKSTYNDTKKTPFARTLTGRDQFFEYPETKLGKEIAEETAKFAKQLKELEQFVTPKPKNTINPV
jgi:hypothetical protein